MADNDVFNKTENPPLNAEQVVSALVGEGKTYKTVEDLAKGKLNADIHIQRVEKENKELREKLAGAKTVDDVLAAVKANISPEGDPSVNEQVQNEGSPALSADQIAKIVSEQITGHETARQKTQNKDKANKAMFEMYGDKALEVFEKEASTPELKDALIKLAEVSPDKFISMFKRDAQRSPGVDSEGSKQINTLNLNPSSGEAIRGTQAYYSGLRKSNPQLYWSAANQLEMHEFALRDPNKYFGRNV